MYITSVYAVSRRRSRHNVSA